MRKTFGTGSVWEQKVGYSRAVQVDNTLYISATAASGEDGIVGEDFYTQARFILDKLGAVLGQGSLGMTYRAEDVLLQQEYLFSRIVTIYGGSQQMQLITVARHILGLRNG